MDDTDHALFPRFSAELVATALKDTPVVMVTGPRQCGKTTLVRDLVGGKREFITMDDDTVQDEVDLVIETGGGALVGIEVKASATVNAGDFKGLRKLAEAGGDNFKLGVVLHDGGRPVPFGDRLVAAPMFCLWA